MSIDSWRDINPASNSLNISAISSNSLVLRASLANFEKIRAEMCPDLTCSSILFASGCSRTVLPLTPDRL